MQMLHKYLPAQGKLKFCFLELSVHLFPIFSVCSWLKAWTWNAGLRRADGTSAAWLGWNLFSPLNRACSRGYTLLSCVTVGKSPKLPRPQLPYLWKGLTITYMTEVSELGRLCRQPFSAHFQNLGFSSPTTLCCLLPHLQKSENCHLRWELDISLASFLSPSPLWPPPSLPIL